MAEIIILAFNRPISDSSPIIAVENIHKRAYSGSLIDRAPFFLAEIMEEKEEIGWVPICSATLINENAALTSGRPWDDPNPTIYRHGTGII